MSIFLRFELALCLVATGSAGPDDGAQHRRVDVGLDAPEHAQPIARVDRVQFLRQRHQRLLEAAAARPCRRCSAGLGEKSRAQQVQQRHGEEGEQLALAVLRVATSSAPLPRRLPLRLQVELILRRGCMREQHVPHRPQLLQGQDVRVRREQRRHEPHGERAPERLGEVARKEGVHEAQQARRAGDLGPKRRGVVPHEHVPEVGPRNQALEQTVGQGLDAAVAVPPAPLPSRK